MTKTNCQRKLLVVPILHTKEDMGSLGSRLPAEDGYSAVVAEFWEEVKNKVKRYLKPSKKIKVYQDGLPATFPKLVEKIICEVKSPNYELLRFLKSKGAKVLGTEDPKLLKEEYQFISQIFTTQDETAKGKLRQAYGSQASDLLAKRDSYIANRINRTLDHGDLGVLFLGAAHKIESKLSKDIQVEIL